MAASSDTPPKRRPGRPIRHVAQTRLQAVRLNARMSQAELSRQAEVSRRTIWRLERGSAERGVNLETLRRIAAVFDMPVSALFPEAEIGKKAS